MSKPAALRVMKIAPLLLATILAIGCASESKPPQPRVVHVGMTKDELLKVLDDKPKRVIATPRGEVWHYDNADMALIPFNFGFRPEFKDFYFDRNGILVDYHILKQ